MPINFTPRRSGILMCDFDLAFVPPEMRKKRRVVILSPTVQNIWKPGSPGTSTVVPLSATRPAALDARAVPIARGSYVALTADVWAKCGMVTTVSNDRLDRVFARGRRISEYLRPLDMAAIEAGIRAALDLR